MQYVGSTHKPGRNRGQATVTSRPFVTARMRGRMSTNARLIREQRYQIYALMKAILWNQLY